MNQPSSGNSVDLLQAFHAQEAKERLGNTMVGCFLVVTLMPAGSLLDFFVYPEHLMPFFKSRLICSSIAALIWSVLLTRFAAKACKFLGVVVPLLPVLFIAWMISKTEGFSSPYYAGLNLVLLAVGAVLRWTFLESIIAVLLVLGIYIGAGLLHGGDVSTGVLFNNFYFIVLMDIIVVVGTFFQYRARFREFALRYELDTSKQQLEDNHRKLLEVDQAKSRFFANISHELRTPLTLLLAPLETMLSRPRTPLDAKSKDMLQTMHSNGMRLLKLINDLLDLVRLDSGVMQVKREAVPIADFLRGLASSARQMAEDKHIKLQTEVAPDVGAVALDRDKLEKVLLNLQFNALKFTPAGGQVTLRASRSADTLVLQVEDTGMGISQTNLPHVFDRFWQADGSSRRKYQGVGIGLALVKELVEVQDGTVSVSSQEGVGTTFTIQFPCSVEAQSATPAPNTTTPDTNAEAAPALPGTSDPALKETPSDLDGASSSVSNEEWLAHLYRRAELFPSMTAVRESVRPVEQSQNSHLPKLLIADDEPDMLRFIKSQLEEHYQILEAVDGQQAVDKTAQFLPDVVLLDMMMPEKDGLQACREIREKTSTRNIPVILLTARADEETKLAALQAGASDFLPKPFSTTELHVRIHNLVELYQFQRQLSKQKHTLENALEQLKETETKLVQSEKLASLGRMSAGIIHEINNPLNFATTGLFTLRKLGQQLPPTDQADYDEILHDIEEGIGRVKTIVSDLRSFSHHDDEQRDLVPVHDVIESALRFLSMELRDRVQVEMEVAPDLCVLANRNKMIQVMVNLIQNSVDAMRDKDYPAGVRPTLRLQAGSEQGRNVLVVRDNGPGIRNEILDKIFDPFFTTKDVGEGMGLGLAICYRIIQDYDGQVTVHSEPGQFCEFKLDFPLAA